MSDGCACWLVDVSDTRRVRMREYAADVAARLEAAFDAEALSASVLIRVRGTAYRVRYDAANGSWKQERCDDASRWRYVERRIEEREARKAQRTSAQEAEGSKDAVAEAAGADEKQPTQPSSGQPRLRAHEDEGEEVEVEEEPDSDSTNDEW